MSQPACTPSTALSQLFSDAQLKPYIQYTSLEANAILETSGRGSFIAPAVGLLHYGPSCYLYDHVCNFNYQGEHIVCPAHSYNSLCHWPFRCPFMHCSVLSARCEALARPLAPWSSTCAKSQRLWRSLGLAAHIFWRSEHASALRKGALAIQRFCTVPACYD